MAKPFDRAQFYEAITLLAEAKATGLSLMGLARVHIEADALNVGLLPGITLYSVKGVKYEHIGDDFYDGLVALRKLIAKAREEARKIGKA